MKYTTYTIPGKPADLNPKRYLNGRYSEEHRNLVRSIQFMLAVQHGDLKKFSGPLHLQATFFFCPDKKESAFRFKHFGRPYATDPTLVKPFEFLVFICEGTLFQSKKLITSADISKVYDENPRTEFRITEIKGGQSKKRIEFNR